jgi:hypothetical protein
LNDLDVLARDVTNAYLDVKCCKKIWFKGGIETGEDKRKVMIVTRALYGLKSSRAAWQADLAATLQDLKFTSIQADPDVWIQSGGTHPKMTMDKLGKLFELKPESVKEPDINLGANMEKVQLPNGKVFWAMGS